MEVLCEAQWVLLTEFMEDFSVLSDLTSVANFNPVVIEWITSFPKS
jgi:hypothetical protein